MNDKLMFRELLLIARGVEPPKDPLELIMLADKVSFPEAVKRLSEWLKIPKNDNDPDLACPF